MLVRVAQLTQAQLGFGKSSASSSVALKADATPPAAARALCPVGSTEGASKPCDSCSALFPYSPCTAAHIHQQHTTACSAYH